MRRKSSSLLDLPRALRDGAEWCWPRQEFLATVHPDDRLMAEDAIRRCLEEGSLLDVEFRAKGHDGSTQWLRATGRALDDGEQGESLHGVIADIEPRKRAEAERADLLRRLAQAQEDERRRIARELHDQVGQSVTGFNQRSMHSYGAAVDIQAPVLCIDTRAAMMHGSEVL